MSQKHLKAQMILVLILLGIGTLLNNEDCSITKQNNTIFLKKAYIERYQQIIIEFWKLHDVQGFNELHRFELNST